MPRSSQGKAVVLVVEDDFLIRANAADMVRDFGFEAIEAVDADDAISVLEGPAAISVVFTDIQMPGAMDGLKLAAFIRDRWPPVKLVLTSGNFRPEAGSLPEGARFILKPYSENNLIELLHTSLAESS